MRRLRLASGLVGPLLGWFAAAVPACEAEERPANLDQDCDGADCRTGGGFGKGSGSGGSSDPDGGGVPDDAGGGVTISGELGLYDDSLLLASPGVLQQVEVAAEAALGGGFVSVVADAQAGYELTGVAADFDVWMGGRALTLADLVHPTYQPIDTINGGGVFDLYLVQRDTLTTIGAQLSNTVFPSASAGHLVIRYFDSNGTPVQGVSVVDSLEAENVAYDVAGGGWSDLVTATGPLGVALVLNVPTSTDFPDGELKVLQTELADGTTCSVVVRMATDSVSVFALPGDGC